MIGGGAAPPPHLIPATPAFKKGALGSDFTSTVINPREFKKPHERDTADHTVGKRGWNVHARRELRGKNLPNPDAMVRRDPQDPGTITEFKRPTRLSYTAIRNGVHGAGEQVAPWGGGDVVIDGRDIAITEPQARQHCAEAIAEAHRKNKPLPAQIHVILGDGEMITIKGK